MRLKSSPQTTGTDRRRSMNVYAGEFYFNLSVHVDVETFCWSEWKFSSTPARMSVCLKRSGNPRSSANWTPTQSQQRFWWINTQLVSVHFFNTCLHLDEGVFVCVSLCSSFFSNCCLNISKWARLPCRLCWRFKAAVVAYFNCSIFFWI